MVGPGGRSYDELICFQTSAAMYVYNSETQVKGRWPVSMVQGVRSTELQNNHYGSWVRIPVVIEYIYLSYMPYCSLDTYFALYATFFA